MLALLPLCHSSHTRALLLCRARCVCVCVCRRSLLKLRNRDGETPIACALWQAAEWELKASRDDALAVQHMRHADACKQIALILGERLRSDDCAEDGKDRLLTARVNRPSEVTDIPVGADCIDLVEHLKFLDFVALEFVFAFVTKQWKLFGHLQLRDFIARFVYCSVRGNGCAGVPQRLVVSGRQQRLLVDCRKGDPYPAATGNHADGDLGFPKRRECVS